MSGEDAQKYLQDIPSWALAEDSVVKEFRFGSYLKGLEFAYSLGKIAKSPYGDKLYPITSGWVPVTDILAIVDRFERDLKGTRIISSS
jgi:hypothetical protein